MLQNMALNFRAVSKTILINFHLYVLIPTFHHTFFEPCVTPIWPKITDPVAAMWRYKWHHVFTGHWALDFRWSCWNQFRDLKTMFLVMKKNEKDPFEKLSCLHLRVLECWPHNLVIGLPHKPIELVSWFQKFQKSTGEPKIFFGWNVLFCVISESPEGAPGSTRSTNPMQQCHCNPGYSEATPRPRYVFLWAAKPLDLVRIRDHWQEQ